MSIIQVESKKPRAAALELSALWREAMQYGHPRVSCRQFIFDKGKPLVFVAIIVRQLGHSKLETSHSFRDTPERALSDAIEEAKLWGLPVLEVGHD